MTTARSQSQQQTAALLGDGRALADIMTMAGPETAPRIRRQMHADLLSTAAALGAGLTATDWTAIRAQTHILISLAGTIGAMRLHALAIDMNAAAHAQDSARTAALALPLLSDLDALTALMAGRATEAGA